jgi:hypothetical protein
MGSMGWTSTVVDHQSPGPLRPLGQVGMARVDRAARVPKGQRGAAIDVSAGAGLLFQPTTPASSVAMISKVPLKPAAAHDEK